MALTFAAAATALQAAAGDIVAYIRTWKK